MPARREVDDPIQGRHGTLIHVNSRITKADEMEQRVWRRCSLAQTYAKKRHQR